MLAQKACYQILVAGFLFKWLQRPIGIGLLKNL